MRLWRALLPLRTLVSVLQTGAHPDDETSRLLARLRSDGLRLAYACATRGEGGQNSIGPETAADLGLLRTAEMEAAAGILDIELYWLSLGEDDAIADFGFSKSAEDTLQRWGKERVIERLVRVIRTAKPDILLPTFLDVGGQHGHHRAITRATEEAFHLAADPAAYPEHAASGLTPWATAKYYLPAFSGAGGSYDDEEPPPPATLSLEVGAVDPVFGATPVQMGEWSRVRHLSQGMGRWQPTAPSQVELHLKASRVGPPGPESSILDGLPRSLADLADGNASLRQAHAAIEEAFAAFPHRAPIADALARAQRLLAGVTVAPEHAHRLSRTIALIKRALAEARHVNADPDPTSSGVPIETGNPAAALPKLSASAMPDRIPLRIGEESAGVAVKIRIENRGDEPAKSVVSLKVPPDWSVFAPTVMLEPGGFGEVDTLLRPPRNLRPGATSLPITIDGAPAFTATTVAYPHIRPKHVARPATVRVCALHIALPEDTRIACVDGGSDRAAQDFAGLGIPVEPLSDADLEQANFTGLDTILVGIFALRTRPALQAALPRLKAWIETGGNLVTLYHRPSDDWDAERTPPAPLAIGQPSLRWRVTNPAAPVTHLAPQHPLLNRPNRIGPEDWQGWVKERGLYFAMSWAPAYEPLIALADPGEEPHRGALLAGRFGRGQHIHVSLALHTQLANLVPGANRLMANLLAKPPA